MALHRMGALQCGNRIVLELMSAPEEAASYIVTRRDVQQGGIHIPFCFVRLDPAADTYIKEGPIIVPQRVCGDELWRHIERLMLNFGR